MALNEGEKQALLTQVTQLINHAESKIRQLGLPHVKVGLFDHRTREPINDPQQLVDMADGKPPAASIPVPPSPPIDQAIEGEAAANTAKRAEETGLE